MSSRFPRWASLCQSTSWKMVYIGTADNSNCIKLESSLVKWPIQWVRLSIFLMGIKKIDFVNPYDDIFII